jgi:acetyl/propionyl-CoA carboxylase alpha subunit
MITSIRRIFIANRGEIARRIAMTAHKMGIETVAICDRKTPPAYLAEFVTAFAIVAQESTALYLNADDMIALAKAHNCDAVHPGFGFLSESSEFATRVIAEGFTWIGPKPQAIEAMASKAAARMAATEAGVPCLPGLNGFEMSSDAERRLKDFASAAGFPLLMKAAYGGGGKGMRIVHSEKELLSQAERASAEALSGFGNGSLIVEKYLPAPRHVEVQILADKHGHVYAIGDRDCSLQRRHQKILEEAPAPDIPADVRSQLHKCAVNLASRVGYDHAGTVEFLLEQKDGHTKFYFLEMNTRLQVEHTVTEEVFGLDLVEWQIRVAYGDKLPDTMANLEPRGHAIEVRIYAEDPCADFFPMPGIVRAFSPALGRGIRWELGLDTVDEITTRFDPMVSKLICTATSRSAALELTAQTLERTLFAGPRNNMTFLSWLCRHPAVKRTAVSTHFIGEHREDFVRIEASERQAFATKSESLLDWLEAGGFQNLLPLPQTIDVDSITKYAFAKQFTGRPSIDPPQILTQFIARSSSEKSITYFGTARTHNDLAKLTLYHTPSSEEYWVGLGPHQFVRTKRFAGSVTDAQVASVDHGLVAPVPGKVLAIKTESGGKAAAGDVVFILESMKMQFEIKAPSDCEIEEVCVEVGAQVAAGDVLAKTKDVS